MDGLACVAALQSVQQVGFHEAHLPDVTTQLLACRHRTHLLAAHPQLLAYRVLRRLDAQGQGSQRIELASGQQIDQVFSGEN